MTAASGRRWPRTNGLSYLRAAKASNCYKYLRHCSTISFTEYELFVLMSSSFFTFLPVRRQSTFAPN
jgi:hypothetical protein